MVTTRQMIWQTMKGTTPLMRESALPRYDGPENSLYALEVSPGFFKRGDTVVVKFSSIGLKEFNFFDSFYSNASSQGDVFSNPANIVSNIDGGLGSWVGYAPRFDTVVCVP